MCFGFHKKLRSFENKSLPYTRLHLPIALHLIRVTTNFYDHDCSCMSWIEIVNFLRIFNFIMIDKSCWKSRIVFMELQLQNTSNFFNYNLLTTCKAKFFELYWRAFRISSKTTLFSIISVFFLFSLIIGSCEISIFVKYSGFSFYIKNYNDPKDDFIFLFLLIIRVCSIRESTDVNNYLFCLSIKT